MKNYFRSGCLLILILFLLAACNNYVAFVPPTKPVTGEPPMQVYFNIPLPVDTAKADVAETDTLTLPDSVVLILPKLCVSQKGTDEPCNCVVDIHLRLLTSKKDILLFGKPTISGTHLLETGGQAMLTILHNGDTLQMRKGQNFTLKIPVKRTQTDYRKMLFFVENSTDLWVPNGPLANAGPEYYTIESNQLDTWLSPAYVHTEGKPNVRIRLGAQNAGPDVTKARLFVIPTKIHSVVAARYSQGDFVPAASLPLGTEVTVVALAKEGNLLWLGMQKTTLQSVMDVALDFKTVSQTELDAALSTL